ncbi:hypothetical protein [Streptomyces sp. NPDC047123]|uniref:hypothetical protein n=1 Tax=Streptomyces sp. NPDC047123 TaxID=3155622 RepID=UPI0033CCAB76
MSILRWTGLSRPVPNRCSHRPTSSTAKAELDLATYRGFMEGEIGLGSAQVDMAGLFTPQRTTSYHVGEQAKNFHEARVDDLEDFATSGVRPGQLVEVSVALLQQKASGRKSTVAGKLVETRQESVATGMRHSAAIEPIDISVTAGSVSIENGNHRLAAAAQLEYAYVPCKLI